MFATHLVTLGSHRDPCCPFTENLGKAPPHLPPDPPSSTARPPPTSPTRPQARLLSHFLSFFFSFSFHFFSTELTTKPSLLHTPPASHLARLAHSSPRLLARLLAHSPPRLLLRSCALQTNSNREAKQAETSLNGNNSMHLENEKQTDLGKRLMDESVEENCDEELGKCFELVS
uniref:Uncharacterized protein n=1 Tax=Ananas comosus var. bracteatus TaxID=296719 RepID=A0A6V7Q6H8_ANACO|nr:unnamed protein product [Ananas comosus var. bracteatus]